MQVGRAASIFAEEPTEPLVGPSWQDPVNRTAPKLCFAPTGEIRERNPTGDPHRHVAVRFEGVMEAQLSNLLPNDGWGNRNFGV